MSPDKSEPRVYNLDEAYFSLPDDSLVILESDHDQSIQLKDLEIKLLKEQVKRTACYHSTKLTAADYIKILDNIGDDSRETLKEIDELANKATEG